jgi:hypothetical protein
MLAPLALHADGGTVQLHEALGPFVVTVFTVPETLRAGPIDTSVLVQDRETSAVILDAAVNLAFQPAAGAGFQTRATHELARNKLLQAATIDIPAPGWWTMHISVSRNGTQAAVATRVYVQPAAPRLAGIWPYLILPPVAIAVFVLHQALRRDSQTPW